MPIPYGKESRDSREAKKKKKVTHIFQCAHFAHDALHLRIILALELIEHRIAILALAIRRR